MSDLVAFISTFRGARRRIRKRGKYVRANGNKAIPLKWICIISVSNCLKKQAAKDNPIIYHGLPLRALHKLHASSPRARYELVTNVVQLVECWGLALMVISEVIAGVNRN